MDDLVLLHRTALDDFDRIVADVTDDDLGLPTPCGDWRVADLLAHSIGQHRGFAAVVRDGDADRACYAPVDWSTSAWQASRQELLDAFSAADLASTAHQVELRPSQRIPIRFIVGAQLLDSAIHAWDLAHALGRNYTPDPPIVASVLAIAEGIPDGANREASDAAFAHAQALLEGESDWERALRLLGREP